MTAPLAVCTGNKQHAVVHLLVSDGLKGVEPLTIGCQVWTELFATMKFVQVDENVQKQVIHCC
jgi:hypothetical protein